MPAFVAATRTSLGAFAVASLIARGFAATAVAFFFGAADCFFDDGREYARVMAVDGEAWVASRLFPSLAKGDVPEAQDIGDAAWLLSLGYRTFMLGDEVCLRRDSVLAALNLLERVAES